jgi:hypothetical protein
MNSLEIRRLEMFKRVRGFGATHVDSFAAGSLGRELFTTVNTVVTELETMAAAQEAAGGSARQGTAGKAAGRTRMHETMERMSRTARAIDPGSTGIAEKFKLPHKASDQVWLNAARAFAAEAVALKEEFLRHEMPPDFIERLNEDIADFERAIQGQNTGNEAKRAGRQSIDSSIGFGMDAVRRLHQIILNKFHDDPPTIAAWEGARHVERTPRPKREGNNNSAPTAQ